MFQRLLFSVINQLKWFHSISFWRQLTVFKILKHFDFLILLSYFLSLGVSIKTLDLETVKKLVSGHATDASQSEDGQLEWEQHRLRSPLLYTPAKTAVMLALLTRRNFVETKCSAIKMFIFEDCLTIYFNNFSQHWNYFDKFKLSI